MSLTAGTLTKLAAGPTTAQLSATAASGGTGPYTQQWYRSVTSGFSPGGGTLIAGATALTLNDSGLVPGTQYYYEVVYTDTGASNATIGSAQLGVLTAAPAPNQNQFQQTTQVGVLDLRYNYDTISAQIDVSQATGLYAGAAVKVVDSADGVPKVIGCSANSDEVFGFINYDQKTIAFLAGAACEISQAGNVMYLYSTGAISRGARVTLDLTTNGGVAQLVGSSGADVVGFALDKATAAGQLIRVKILVPSFLKA